MSVIKPIDTIPPIDFLSDGGEQPRKFKLVLKKDGEIVSIAQVQVLCKAFNFSAEDAEDRLCKLCPKGEDTLMTGTRDVIEQAMAKVNRILKNHRPLCLYTDQISFEVQTISGQPFTP